MRETDFKPFSADLRLRSFNDILELLIPFKKLLGTAVFKIMVSKYTKTILSKK